MCEGKLMLLHVFVSTDVGEPYVLDLLRLPGMMTWKAGLGVSRQGGAELSENCK